MCRVRCVAYPGGGAGGGAEPGEDLVDQQPGEHRKLRVAEHPFPAGPGHQRPHGRAAGGGAGVADAGGGPVAVPVGDRVPQVVGGLRVRRGTQRGVARSVPACQARWNLSEWSDHGKIAVLSRAVVCLRRPGKGRRRHRKRRPHAYCRCAARDHTDRLVAYGCRSRYRSMAAVMWSWSGRSASCRSLIDHSLDSSAVLSEVRGPCVSAGRGEGGGASVDHARWSWSVMIGGAAWWGGPPGGNREPGCSSGRRDGDVSR